MSVVYKTICDEPGCNRSGDGVINLLGWVFLEGGVWYGSNENEGGRKIPYAHLCPDHVPEWAKRMAL